MSNPPGPEDPAEPSGKALAAARSPTPRAWSPRVGVAVVAALVVLFFADVLLTGETLALRDIVFDALPWRRYAADALTDGQIPLWNPYSRFGQPFVANPQSSVFYPGYALFLFVSPPLAVELTIVLHLILAAAGAFLLGRHLRLTDLGALLLAVTFAFGSYMVVNLEFMSVMVTLAWCPTTILLVCRAARAAADAADAPLASDRAAYLAGLRAAAPTCLALAIVLALQVLGGQPQPLLFTLAAAALLAMTEFIARERRGPSICAAATGVAAAGVLGLWLGAVQILPTAELLPLSVRAEQISADLDIASVHPQQLLTAVFPFAFGRPGVDAWWGHTLFEFWLGCFHVGLLPLVLATFALPAWLPARGGDESRARLLTRRAVLVAAGVALVTGSLLAFGAHAPVYGPLYEWFPGFDRLRWPAKALQLVVIALCVLAGMGASWLERDAGSRRGLVRGMLGGWTAVWLVVAWVALVADTGAVLRGIAIDALPERAGDVDAGLAADARRTTLFLGLSIALLAARFATPLAARAGLRKATPALLAVLAAANLYSVAHDIVPRARDSLYTVAPASAATLRREPVPVRVHTLFAHAQMSMYGVRDEAYWRDSIDGLGGESSLPHRIFKTYGGDALNVHLPHVLSHLIGGEDSEETVAERIADIAAVERVVYGPPMADVVAGVAEKQVLLTGRPTALPYAYVVDGWEIMPGWEEQLHRIADPRFDPRRAVVVDPATPAMERDRLTPTPPVPLPSPPGLVRAVTHDWNAVTVDVDIDRPGMLVLTETWFPGWRATVDGREVPIHRVNVTFRGVRLPAGSHVVEMRYEPRSFRTGLIGSLSGLAVWVLLWLTVRGRRRVSPGETPARPS